MAERAAVHAIDERPTERMLDLAESQWGRKFDIVDALGAIGIPAQEADFFSAFAAHHFPGQEGIPPRELLLREEGRKLKLEERSWLDAQAAALVSVWEVTDVAPDQGISLRNLLGRVVDHAGTTLLCGIHPRALPPREGSLVVKAIRKAVRSRARVVPRNKLLEAALRRGGPPGGPGSGGEGEQPPELQAMVRAVKEKHYRAWLDERIPAIGGLTPREAARGKAKDRQALALLVAEIENHEARLPEGQRFDVVGLRRELGLPG